MGSLSALCARILILLIVSLPFSTAQITCGPSYGAGITCLDCKEAISSLPWVMLTQYAMRGEQAAMPILFSRNAGQNMNLHHMPLTLVGQKCLFGVDLSDPAPPSRLSSVEAFVLQLRRLLSECVGKHGYGGKLEREGFEFLLVNPEQTKFRSTYPGQMSLSRSLAPLAGGLERTGSSAGLSSIARDAGDSNPPTRQDGSP